MKTKSKGQVLLGMSGGVDSSVAAYLLKKDGFDVVGVTFEMWEKEEHLCVDIPPSSIDAKNVCDMLSIPHYLHNVKNDFKKYVIDYFISEYESGRTPNPCVICNRYVKFEALVNKAKELNIEYIATGHYANIEFKDNQYFLKKAVDESKDQSYFLYNLTSEQISKTLFPLGKYTKREIREIAKELKLPVASKPDSQEVCFIPNNDYRTFIQENGTQKSINGEFTDIDGNILGYHKGVSQYTIGQRRGLGVVTGQPLFVIEINKEKNQIVLGLDNQLLSKELTATDLNWFHFNELEKKIKVEAKIRYRAKPSKAVAYPMEDNKVKVLFENEQRAITKGQAVVFYSEDTVLGGGIIC